MRKFKAKKSSMKAKKKGTPGRKKASGPKRPAKMRVKKLVRQKKVPQRKGVTEDGRTASMGKKKSLSLKGMGLRQVAAAICSYLSDLGFDPILTGRACAAIYGGAAVKTNSMDFVVSEYVVKRVREAMRRLGFSCRVHRTYTSKGLQFEVSFLPPPLAVGDNVITETDVIKTNKGNLRLLSPTDCVRQRLSAYYRFGDKEALGDAVVVAGKYKVDMDLIRRWSHWEWASDRFEEFLKLMEAGDR